LAWPLLSARRGVEERWAWRLEEDGRLTLRTFTCWYAMYCVFGTVPTSTSLALMEGSFRNRHIAAK